MAREPRTAAPRLAIVSGASSGIGMATTLLLAEQGWQVVALGRRAVPPEAFAQHAAVRYGAADLAQEDPEAVLVRVAPEALAQVHALVHCAGHDLGGGADFRQHAPDDWRAILRLNLESGMRLAQLCLPAMLARERGDLVLIGSITSRRASPGLAAYSTSKHALKGFAQALRSDYRDSGLRVTEIVPGVVRSGFAGRRWQDDPARAKAFYERFAQCLEPEDVARAIGYVLAQPAHVAITEMVMLPTRERG